MKLKNISEFSGSGESTYKMRCQRCGTTHDVPKSQLDSAECPACNPGSEIIIVTVDPGSSEEDPGTWKIQSSSGIAHGYWWEQKSTLEDNTTQYDEEFIYDLLDNADFWQGLRTYRLEIDQDANVREI